MRFSSLLHYLFVVLRNTVKKVEIFFFLEVLRSNSSTTMIERKKYSEFLSFDSFLIPQTMIIFYKLSNVTKSRFIFALHCINMNQIFIIHEK